MCRWLNKCGVWYEGTCEGSRWNLEPPPCTTCPSLMPIDGTECTSDKLACNWKNGCGTYDYAVCSDKKWVVITPECSPLKCPTAAPAPSGPCDQEGVTCGWPGNCDAGHVEATCTSGAWVFTPGCI